MSKLCILLCSKSQCCNISLQRSFNRDMSKQVGKTWSQPGKKNSPEDGSNWFVFIYCRFRRFRGDIVRFTGRFVSAGRFGMSSVLVYCVVFLAWYKGANRGDDDDWVDWMRLRDGWKPLNRSKFLLWLVINFDCESKRLMYIWEILYNCR